MTAESPGDEFRMERHGDITLMVASPALEMIDPTLIEDAAAVLLEPLQAQTTPLVVIDLGQVDYFGSAFLSLLLRCWKLTKVKNGQMVLACVSDRARELLRLTSLDLVWPMYATRREAFEALLAD